MKYKSSLIAAVLAAVILCLSGCSSVEVIDQPQNSKTIELTHDFSLGQTIVPKYDGLDGVLLYLEPSHSHEGSITLKLKSNPNQDSNLRTSSIPLEEIISPGFYKFGFAPVEESRKTGFYFVLKLHGDGSIKVGTSSGDQYLNGSMYKNHKPQDEQISFNLSLNRKLALQGLLKELGITAIVLVFLPSAVKYFSMTHTRITLW